MARDSTHIVYPRFLVTGVVGTICPGTNRPRYFRNVIVRRQPQRHVIRLMQTIFLVIIFLQLTVVQISYNQHIQQPDLQPVHICVLLLTL